MTLVFQYSCSGTPDKTRRLSESQPAYGNARMVDVIQADRILRTQMELKIGPTLRKLMKEHGLTLRTLAQMTGVSPSTLGEWRQNRPPRNVVHVKKVADFLGVTMHFLLFGVDDSHEHPKVSQILKDDLFSGVFEITLRKLKLNERGDT